MSSSSSPATSSSPQPQQPTAPAMSQRASSSSSVPTSATLSDDGSQASTAAASQAPKCSILRNPVHGRPPGAGAPAPSPPASQLAPSVTPSSTATSRIHFAPLPPAPERRHSISLGVASRSALLHSQGQGSDAASAKNGGQVQWIAMTDEEWAAYTQQYASGGSTSAALGGAGGQGQPDVPDLGTFVVQGGRKMFSKLRSLSSASSTSSGSADSSVPGGADGEQHGEQRKGAGGLLRFGRTRNRSVSPAGAQSTAAPMGRASSAGPAVPSATAATAATPIAQTVVPEEASEIFEEDEDEAAEASPPPGATTAKAAPAEDETLDDVVVVVRKSRPPSPAPAKHRSPPPSESAYAPSDDDERSTSSLDDTSSASGTESESESDVEPAPMPDRPSANSSRIAFHPPTPPLSGTTTPLANGGTRSRRASITVADLPSHPGRQAQASEREAERERERERLILGFVGGLERVALERKEAEG